MKLFNAIATAAVIGTSLVTANPAEAQRAPNGWIQTGCSDSGCIYVKHRNRNGNFVNVEVRDTQGGGGYGHYLTEFSCGDWKERSNYPSSKGGYQGWGGWEDVLPGTVFAHALQVSCST